MENKIDKMTIQITEAIPSDTSLLSDLIRKSNQDVALRFNLTIENAPTHPSNCINDWVTADFEKGKTYYVLREELKACGCVVIESADDQTFYLGRLGVLPECRKKGYGTALVEVAESEARKKGAILIQIGIIGENTELKKWYEKRGFIFKENLHFDHLPFTVCIMYHNLS